MKYWFYYIDDWKLLTVKQIAEITGLSTTTIYGQHFRNKYLHPESTDKPANIPEIAYSNNGPVRLRQPIKHSNKEESSNSRIIALEERVQKLEQLVSTLLHTQ